MKQLKNGLNAVYYYDLSSMIDEGESIASIIQKAQAIVEARKQNSGPLQKAKDNTLIGLEDLQSSLETLKEKIGDYCEDNAKVKKITEEADRILKNIPLFRTSAEVLCSRLSEGKIRIVSIGEKSQGKTLFTQILTGLPPTSKLLKVKAPDNINDCTGAVNTFYHKTGQELPLIMVDFLTVKEVVDYIKEAIKLIQKEKGINDSNWTLSGIDSIRDKNSLKSFLSDTNHKAKIANLSINPEVKSSLTQYFENGVGFVDLLDNPQKIVSENDVDEFNDMQHPTKHFLAVKRINVTLDLYREGLFQYFEVADTKGLSVVSGAVANQMIYDVINESDAVFSIARTGQQQNWKIYTQALGEKYRNDEVFRKKHFAIINVEEGFDMTSADEGAKWIDEQKLSDYCYIGRLKEDSGTDCKDSSVPKKENDKKHCVPSNFVNTLIIHMLSKIADHIMEIDNERVKVCQQSGKNIAESLSKLKELLRDINFKEFDEEKLVKEKVRGFCKAALEYIDLQKEEIRKEKEKKVDEDESDNDLYYQHVTDKSNENRFASVYEVLTGEHYPGKLPQIDDDDEDYVDEEVRKAVNDLFQSEKVQSRIANNLDFKIFVGQYADELVWAFRHVILKPLFDREKQHPIACKKKEDYFKELWEIFKLGQISAEHNKWNAEYVNDNIHEMKHLNDVYNKGVFDPFEQSNELLTPYSFLKEYFRLLSYRLHDSDDEVYIEKQKLDDKLILEAIENEINKLSIRKKIIARIKNFPDAIESYCTNIADAIGNFAGDVAKYGCQYYKDNIDFIVSEEDKERLEKSRHWKDVDVCRSYVIQYKFENLPLISINE